MNENREKFMSAGAAMAHLHLALEKLHDLPEQAKFNFGEELNEINECIYQAMHYLADERELFMF